jgi:epoxyqueuosine reductase
MIDRLRRWAAGRGYQVGWAPPAALAVAREDVLSRRRSGEIDPRFYAAALVAFENRDPPPWEGAAAVVVVVMPRPAHKVTFTIGNRTIEALLPPTYLNYDPLFEDVRRDLEQHGLPGARVARLTIPLKSLAARLGLVRYGRNNVTYAPGLGSYLQLFGYLTDAALPVPADWRPCEPALLPECADCAICGAACPTGAIGEDRVLLHTERCLTFINEYPGTWPDWIAAQAHCCLVGCLWCQRACPANADLPIVETGIVFSADETRTVLAGDPDRRGAAWDGVRAKLTALGQSDLDLVLTRNLRALLRNHPPAR